MFSKRSNRRIYSWNTDLITGLTSENDLLTSENNILLGNITPKEDIEPMQFSLNMAKLHFSIGNSAKVSEGSKYICTNEVIYFKTDLAVAVGYPAG